ncbi:MAG: Maf family protein [Bacteroidales bacterium]|jgi:septum formation protein|nr:Maf family protein [Bacteroidales bacterium]
MFLLDKLSKYSIVLASNSERRQQLLSKLGIDFQVDTPSIEEKYSPDLPPDEIVCQLARQKAEIVALKHHSKNSIVIAGDTIVCADNQILGKPKNNEQAKRMLHLLSDAEHTVYSGLCIVNENITLCRSDVAKVRFRKLNDNEIEYYIAHFQPFDKAGAYGIQQWIGLCGITSIEGSFYTIMGFPTHLLWEMLSQIVEKRENN